VVQEVGLKRHHVIREEAAIARARLKRAKVCRGMGVALLVASITALCAVDRVNVNDPATLDRWL
jgi:hypothetical protein